MTPVSSGSRSEDDAAYCGRRRPKPADGQDLDVTLLSVFNCVGLMFFGIVSDLTIRADRDVVDPLARQSSDVSPLGASRAGLRLVRPCPTGC